MPSHEVSIVVQEAYLPPFRVKQIRATDGLCVLKHRIEFGFLQSPEEGRQVIEKLRAESVLGAQIRRQKKQTNNLGDWTRRFHYSTLYDQLVAAIITPTHCPTQDKADKIQCCRNYARP
jgi:hypothetical protein